MPTIAAPRRIPSPIISITNVGLRKHATAFLSQVVIALDKGLNRVSLIRTRVDKVKDLLRDDAEKEWPCECQSKPSFLNVALDALFAPLLPLLTGLQEPEGVEDLR
jgi:hypothetical protein